MAKTNAEHQRAYRDRQQKHIADLETRVCEAYEIALGMIGAPDLAKGKALKTLLDVLNARDLLRKRRRDG